MNDKRINGNRIADIQRKLRTLDEEETRLVYINFQSDSEKARLREIWAEQRELRNELNELGAN